MRLSLLTASSGGSTVSAEGVESVFDLSGAESVDRSAKRCMFRKILYCVVVLGGGIVASGWGFLLEVNFSNLQLHAEAWAVWLIVSQVFFAAFTYPAGLPSLSVWWLWRAGISTAAESVVLQFPLAAALGFLQWFVVFPKLFSSRPVRTPDAPPAK